MFPVSSKFKFLLFGTFWNFFQIFLIGGWLSPGMQNPQIWSLNVLKLWPVDFSLLQLSQC